MGRPLKEFANASLSIFWPKENSVGKWFLYLTHISSEGVQSVPCSPVDEVNPLQHIKVIISVIVQSVSNAFTAPNQILSDTKSWHDPPRKRREAQHEALSADGATFLPTQRKYRTLVGK